MQPTGTGSTRPEGTGATAWGALVAAFVNGLLLVIGRDFLPTPSHLLIAMSLNAMIGGFTTANRPGFTATVLTLTGPHVSMHSSPPLGGIALGLFYGCIGLPFDRFDFGALFVTLAIGTCLVTYGFVCTYPLYWLLVQFGASSRRLLRRFSRKQHPQNCRSPTLEIFSCNNHGPPATPMPGIHLRACHRESVQEDFFQ